MTGRSAAVQGGLAALGLLAAQLTWTREPERAPGEAIVIDAAKADVSRLRWDDEESTLSLERRTEGGDPVVWLHLEEKSKAPSASAAAKTSTSTSEAPEPDAKPTTPPRDLRGNPEALKLADRFAPLVSPRAFGVLEPSKLKELGLDAPKRHLELVVRGDVRKYDVGIALNAQNGESFLRDTRDGHVYLMPRGLLAELGNGKRLIDSRLHVFETKEFDHVLVTASGKHKDFVHVGRDNFTTDGYTSAKAPDKHDATAKNWLDSVWRTFPTEVLGKDERPTGGALEPLVRVDYSEQGKPVGWIEIARLEGMKAPPGQISETLYARTEHTVGWAHLHAQDQLVTDGEHLVAAP